MNSKTVVLAAVTLLLFTPSLALAQQPSPVVDPEGDAVDTFGEGPPLHDLGVVEVTHGAMNLDVSIMFYGPVEPPSSGDPNLVIGFVELDVDQDPGTGVPPVQNTLSPPFTTLAMGVEYLILVDDFNGQVTVLDALTQAPVAAAPVIYGAQSISFSIPLEAIDADGPVHFSALFGSLAQPTDALDVVGVSAQEEGGFVRGECNGDGALGLADPIHLLAELMGAGNGLDCLESCDANDDDELGLADAVFALNFIFLDGATPPAPYPGCSTDPTGGALGCESYPSCAP